MKIKFKKLLLLVLIIINLVACNSLSPKDTLNADADFNFTVDPEIFQIKIKSPYGNEIINNPNPKRIVSDFKESRDSASWYYPEENMNVSIYKVDDYLKVNISCPDKRTLIWPSVNGDSYTLPLWEGKHIPSDDFYWKEFLKNKTYTFSEAFSMNFFAINKQNHSFLFIVENIFDNEIIFNTKDKINFLMEHNFVALKKNQDYSFRIYLTEKDPIKIAQTYKKYILSENKYVSLKEKSDLNPNIKKLYGAPFIYLWNKEILWIDNIKWYDLRKNLDNKVFVRIKTLANNSVDDGKNLLQSLESINKQDYISLYDKKQIVSLINKCLTSKKFYMKNTFDNIDHTSKEYLSIGIDKLNTTQLYDLNKRLLKNSIPNLFTPIDTWGNGKSIELIKNMKNSGIENAWLGFSGWKSADPNFVDKATNLGYLVAPYDSYHSIHNGNSVDWDTAFFEDTSLYERATIENINHKKISGFLNRGRKLNPTLSMKSVENRFDTISSQINFNSWFVDVDGTGEFHNDYSKSHPTIMKEDMNARLNRLSYFSKEKKMVLGTETGNDFCSPVIAFSHGLETPVLTWEDPDLRQNKDSAYYLGSYWSLVGIPSRYVKEVPLKEIYKQIYFSPEYKLPLFKLVYNDSVITSHHWESGSLKFTDEIQNNMLYEVFFNISPLYHMDKDNWKKYKDIIVPHVKLWATYNKIALTKEITDFKILSKNRLIQSISYGKDLKIIGNFSDDTYSDNNLSIKPKTIQILYKNKITNYTPQI